MRDDKPAMEISVHELLGKMHVYVELEIWSTNGPGDLVSLKGSFMGYHIYLDDVDRNAAEAAIVGEYEHDNILGRKVLLRIT